MYANMLEQVKILFLTCLSGVLMAFAYDCIRLFRLHQKHHMLFIQLEDLLYWIVVALFVFEVLFKINYGQVRIVYIFGVFMGMFAYKISISNFILYILNQMYCAIIQKSIAFFYFILKPIRYVIHLFSYPYHYISKRYYRLELLMRRKRRILRQTVRKNRRKLYRKMRKI